MRIVLRNQIESDFFHLEDARQAEQLAAKGESQVYCWKTSGRSNWLERGLSISDVLGLVILPKGLSEIIEMPDDPIENQIG